MRDQPDAGNMPSLARKGRGAVTNPPVRFDSQVISPFDDGWETLGAEFGELPKLTTTLTRDATKSAIAGTARRTSASTVPSIRIVAASTAASTAMRDRRTRISATRPGSISRPS